VLGEVSRMPEPFFKPDDRWIEWAQKEGVRLFRRRFEERRDEHHAGRPVHTITANVTPEGLADLRRARLLISRQAKRIVGLGKTIEILALEWTRRHDPLLVKLGLRRVPDTSLLPGSRYVPSEVDRTIRIRDDDRCIVPFCTHEFRVEDAHLVPHRAGGSCEAKNMAVLWCWHNWLELIGEIVLAGDADDPIVLDRHGEPLGERFRPELGCDGRPSRKPGEREPTPQEELAAFLGEARRSETPKEPAEPTPSEDDDDDPVWLVSLKDPEAEAPTPREPEVHGNASEGDPGEGDASEGGPGEGGGSEPEEGGEPRAPP
jgi:hypothetical protein